MWLQAAEGENMSMVVLAVNPEHYDAGPAGHNVSTGAIVAQILWDNQLLWVQI